MLKIRELREKRGLKQKELAALLGIPPNTLNQYENNKREPDHEALCKIADFFNVPIDYLFGRNNIIDSFVGAESLDPTLYNEYILKLVMSNIKNDHKTEISLSPEKERLIKEIQQASDDDLKEMEYILKYLKSKKEKNEDAATFA